MNDRHPCPACGSTESPEKAARKAELVRSLLSKMSELCRAKDEAAKNAKRAALIVMKQSVKSRAQMLQIIVEVLGSTSAAEGMVTALMAADKKEMDEIETMEAAEGAFGELNGE